MQPYPHTYTALANGTPTGTVSVASDSVLTLLTAPPKEFGGPGDQWSPESLLCAAIADCFILTFRTVARSSQLTWSHLSCRVEGTLERVQDESQFTRFVTYAELTVPSGTDLAKSKRLAEKAEHGCLIANSLRGSRLLEIRVIEQ